MPCSSFQPREALLALWQGCTRRNRATKHKQDPSSTDKEVWELAHLDNDPEEDEVIIEKHQDEVDDELKDQEEHHDELEDQEAEGDEDERPGEPLEMEPQAPLQAELRDGDREEAPGDPVRLRWSTRIWRPPD